MKEYHALTSSHYLAPTDEGYKAIADIDLIVSENTLRLAIGVYPTKPYFYSDGKTLHKLSFGASVSDLNLLIQDLIDMRKNLKELENEVNG